MAMMMRAVSPIPCWCLVFLWLNAQQALSSSTPSLTSPVRHWDASWTASGAQGTAMAMTFSNDCVLLFLRSPASNVWKPTAEESSISTEMFRGLLVEPMDTAQQVNFAPSWLSFSNTLCAMTGLASDVEHLARILQRQVDTHYNVYSKSLTTHAMTERLSKVVQGAAQAKGGRPFGVQTLLVGGDDIDASRGLCVYSMDPSGSWQSWGGASAIGKYAKQVRQELAKKRNEPAPETLEQALQRIVECWIETCKHEDVNMKAEEDYQVLILEKNTNGGGCRLMMVNEDVVRGIVEQATAALVD
jgi:20S proteasome alpha/beta subunit